MIYKSKKQMLVGETENGFIVTTFTINEESQNVETKTFEDRQECLEFACNFFQKKA